MTSAAVSPGTIADAVARMRQAAPLVQCLTNIVVANWTANALLAAGACPAMVDNPHEAGEFAAAASGVLVNLGTPYDDTTTAMFTAAAGARTAGTPWVLDPVAIGALPWRTPMARNLLTGHRPDIVRGNASEIIALAGGTGGRGTDSTATGEEALGAAREIAGQHGCVVAASGPVDVFVSPDGHVVRLANGDPMLTRVTGAGCSLGALIAASAGVVPPLLAAVAATAHLTIAAEDAIALAPRPGSFAVALLDALDALTPEHIAQRARLS